MTAAAAIRLFDPEVGVPGGRRRFRMMLLMRIGRWDVRQDGPLTEAALEQKIGRLGYEITGRLFTTGSAGATQSDLRERLVGVAHGLVKVTVDGESAILGAGDLVFVPRGSVRRVAVIGPAAALCLEAVRPPGAA